MGLNLCRDTIKLDEPEVIGVDDLVFEVAGSQFEDGRVVCEEGESRADAKKGHQQFDAHADRVYV